MFNIASNKWTKLGRLNEPRMGHGCGLARKQDGTMVAVVAGGLPNGGTTFETYNFDDDEWR